MTSIPEYTASEIQAVQDAIDRRYGRSMVIEVVETELRLHPDDREVTPCPALYWEGRAARFLVTKTGESRYRPLFFYRVRTVYTTDLLEYDNLQDGVTAILKAQADHEAKGGEG